MAFEILTKQDLLEFKSQLFKEMKEIIQPNSNCTAKKWLKSIEVRDLLKISPGTLQTLRVNGVLNYTRMGNIFYYDQDDIQKILEANKNKIAF